MTGISATDVAIRMARQGGTLKVEAQEGRFGSYWTISDEFGLIEVAMSAAEVEERINV